MLLRDRPATSAIIASIHDMHAIRDLISIDCSHLGRDTIRVLAELPAGRTVNVAVSGK
jgi:hypothetical protein